MKSFKQFLEEAVRTTDRAAELAAYIFARAKRKKPSRMMFPPVLKASTPEEGFTQKHFNVMMKLHKRKSDDGEWQDVPIKNIRTPQRYLDPEGIQKKIKGDDKASGELRGLNVNGKIHIPDGNHRISASYLKGNKTVRIKVYD